MNDKTGKSIRSKRIKDWLAKNQDIVVDAFYGDVGDYYPRYEIYFGTNIDLEKLINYRAKYTLREDTASEILFLLKKIDTARSYEEAA